MMYQKTLAFILASSVAAPALALSQFNNFIIKHAPQHVVLKSSKAPIMKGEQNRTDFSGEWVGTCSNTANEEETLLITQQDDEITFNNELFHINALKNDADVDNKLAMFINTKIQWNADHTSLIMNYVAGGHSFLPSIEMYTVVGSGTLSLNNDQLVMAFRDSSFTNDGDLDENSENTCTYTRKSSEPAQ